MRPFCYVLVLMLVAALGCGVEDEGAPNPEEVMLTTDLLARMEDLLDSIDEREDDFHLQTPDPQTPSPDDEMQEALNNKQLIEVLLEFIQSEADTTDDLNDENIKELLSRLRTQLDMSDEDRLLLRLRFCEGLKVNEISQRLHLKGNLYKRINGLIENLKSACQQCGLVVS